jgi:hypothetical protein
MAYSGHILINTRVAKDLSAIAQLPFGPDSRLPKIDELNRFLSFLGLYTLADSLLYDPTIPTKYLDEFLLASEVLQIKNQFHPLGYVVGDEFVTMVSEALQMATNSIHNSLDDLPPAWRQPDPSDVGKFFRCIDAMMQSSTEEKRLDIAMDEFNKETHGGKLLVALSTDCNNALLKKVHPLVTESETTKSDVVSAMISNFRTFLLMRWSGLQGAIFATGPEFIQKVSEYKLWALEALTENLRGEFCSESSKTHTTEAYSFPLLGMAILLEAPDNSRPIDLLYHASNLSVALHVPAIQKEVISLQASAASDDEIKGIVKKLSWEIRKRNGPKFEKNKGILAELAYEILPTLAIGLVSGGLPLLAGADLKQALLGLSGAGVTTSLFSICSKLSSGNDLVGAISNLVAYDVATIDAIWEKVEVIWRSYGKTI